MSEKPQFVLISEEQKISLPRLPFSQTNVRWFALCLACLLLFGDAYAFDNPMALQSTIQSDMDLNNLQFNMLYSVYSIPNIILPFFGGMLIDKMGVRISIFAFSSVLLFGQVIVVIGGYMYSYFTMLAGRTLFGIGSESLNAAQAAIMAHWFRGRQVSLALGLCLSIPKLGSALNSFLSPVIQQKYGSLGFTLLVSWFIVFFSWFCGLLLIYLDSLNEKQEKAYDKQIPKESQSFEIGPIQKQDSLMLERELSISSIKSDDYDAMTLSPQESPDLGSLQEPFLQSSTSEIKEDTKQHGEEVEPKEEINFEDFKELDGSFWILACIIMLSEALFVPFLDNGNAFFQSMYGFSQEQAGFIYTKYHIKGLLLTIPYVMASMVTPLIGCYVDKFRRRSLLIIVTCVVFCMTHLFLLLLSCDTACGIAAIPLLSLGLCYSLYSSVLIPSIPLVVKHQMLGTAFGLVGVFQNTALALFPLITGHIFTTHYLNAEGQPDPQQGYFYQSIFFVGMSFMNMIVSITLHLLDVRGNKKLNTRQIHKK